MILKVLRAEHVAALVATAIAARLATGMVPLGIVLLVHGETGSFGRAGLVAGAFSLGLGGTGPLLGRVIDRRGASVVLIPGATVFALSVVALVVLDSEATVALAVTAAVAGGALPPMGGVLRRLWPDLVGPDLQQAAFAIDAIIIEALFIAGPLLMAGLATAASPSAGLLAAAAISVSGVIAFDRLTRPYAPPPVTEPRPRGGALATPGMRLVVGATLGLGAMFGALEIALPAFGAEHGNAALGGPFNALLAAGSVAGALAYGSRSLAGPAVLFPVLAILQVASVAPLLAAGSVGVMLALAPLAGIFVAPQMAARSAIITTVAPAGTVVEAFTWIGLSATAGASAGSAVAGPLVEAHGWRAGVLMALATAALGALALGLRRSRLSAPAPSASAASPTPAAASRAPST